MTSGIDAGPRALFDRLVAGVAEQRWDELPQLYAPDAVVRHPFAADASALLAGREQLREHFAAAGATGVAMAATNITVHEANDPEVITAEFTYRGRNEHIGERFELPAVFVLRVRDSQIVASNDYFGPRRSLGGTG